MGACPKLPGLPSVDGSSIHTLEKPFSRSVAVLEPPLAPGVPVAASAGPSPDEHSARQTIARYRQRLEWVFHVPEFEPAFAEGLRALGLPEPRRGIGLRALVDALMLEAKKDLFLWILAQFRGLLPGETAWRLAANWDCGHGRLNRLDVDQSLSTARWPEFRDRLCGAILGEHRRYKDAQRRLFALHCGLPERLALRLVFDPAKRADARQEGCLGLLHAIDKTDAGETPFAGYAQQWITRAIRNYLLGERFPVHVPVNLASSLLCESNRAAPGALLAHRPERSLLQPRVSLDAPPAPDARPIALPDDSCPCPRDLLNRQEVLRIVEDMLAQLSDKQREVLVRRYGLGAGQEAQTLVNIAQSVGISHQQVSMRERRALEKLGAILRPMYRELHG